MAKVSYAKSKVVNASLCFASFRMVSLECYINV